MGVSDLDRLAGRARMGDTVAMAGFVSAVHGDVWRFCAHLTRPDEADDLAQESLLRVVQHLDRWDRGPVRAWVIGVSRLVCFEHLRRVSRRKTHLSAELPERSAPDEHGPTDPLDALARLPIVQRDALVLTQIIGMSYAEAAALIDCPIGTVRSRVARGRDELTAALHPENQVERRASTAD